MNLNIDTGKFWEFYNNSLGQNNSLNNNWLQILDELSKDFPAELLNKFKTYDLEKERESVFDWLNETINKEPFDKNICSFWFGLEKFTTQDKPDDEFYCFYLVGCEEYDKDDIEWATDPVYLPENRYYSSSQFNEIYETIKKDEESFEILDWILPVAYFTYVLNDLIKSKWLNPLFLTHKKKIHISSGHDSGDYVNLSNIQ